MKGNHQILRLFSDVAVTATRRVWHDDQITGVLLRDAQLGAGEGLGVVLADVLAEVGLVFGLEIAKIANERSVGENFHEGPTTIGVVRLHVHFEVRLAGTLVFTKITIDD